MRSISFSVTILLALLSSAALAQQPTGTTGDKLTISPPPASPPPTRYSTGALPQADTGPGRDVVGADDTTKTVKAVPCSTAARETDGTTTCVGIPEGRTEGRSESRK
jgi:hypothetical protein